MAESENNLITYLNANDLAVNMLVYRCSDLEPVTKESVIDLFSNERRRLVNSLKQFQLYDESGSLYVDGVGFDELYKEITDMQQNGIPEPMSPEKSVDYDVIMSMVNYLRQQNITVYGTNQKPYDNWDVLDDPSLRTAQYQAEQTGESQLQMIHGEDGPIYLIDQDANKVLVLNDKLETDIDFDQSDFYTVVQPDGNIMLDNIPVDKLELVLLAVTIGFDAKQIKSQFLWPNLSANLVADSRLVFERSFCSELREIKTINDLKSIRELPVSRDEQHLVSKYRFRGDSKDWSCPIAFSDSDLLDVFSWLYNDKTIDTNEVVRELSDQLVDEGNNMNLVIYRQQRSIFDVCEVNELSVEDNGDFKVEGTKRDGGGQINFVENVYTVLDETSNDIVMSHVSIEDLVNFLMK